MKEKDLGGMPAEAELIAGSPPEKRHFVAYQMIRLPGGVKVCAWPDGWQVSGRGPIKRGLAASIEEAKIAALGAAGSEARWIDCTGAKILVDGRYVFVDVRPEDKDEGEGYAWCATTPGSLLAFGSAPTRAEAQARAWAWWDLRGKSQALCQALDQHKRERHERGAPRADCQVCMGNDMRGAQNPPREETVSG